MALLGHGDARWLVEERKDGTNVNQWHWSEKDCLAWTKQRLSQLLDGLPLASGPLTNATITTVESVTGEAFLNVRKKKLIPSYELAVKAGFEGKVLNDDGSVLKEVSGKIELPYLAEENHDEDCEVKVLTPEEDQASKRLREAILADGKQAIHRQLRVFVDEFHAGKPAGHADQDHSDANAAANGQKSAPAPKPPSAGRPAPVAAAAAPSSQSSSTHGTRSIVIKEQFYASARDIYEALTNENRVRAFTQSDASISGDVGGRFTMFGGSVEGIQRELQPGKKIVQDWRFSNWKDGHYSQVTIDIEEPESGRALVTMSQVNIPEEDKYGNIDVVGSTENGWRNLIFYRIKAVFGYGL